MKTPVLVPAGLVLAAVLSFSSTGCRITHYNVGAPRTGAAEEATCKTTCDRLIEQQAISSDAVKVCLSACRSEATAAAPVADAPVTPATPVTPVTPAATARQPVEESPCARREDASPCRKDDRAARGHRRKQPPAPPPAAAPDCQTDWDCPEDMACDSGACK